VYDVALVHWPPRWPHNFVRPILYVVQGTIYCQPGSTPCSYSRRLTQLPLTSKVDCGSSYLLVVSALSLGSWEWLYWNRGGRLRLVAACASSYTLNPSNPYAPHCFITSLNISQAFPSLKRSLFFLNHFNPSKPNRSKVCFLLYDYLCFTIPMLIICLNCYGTVYVFSTLHFRISLFFEFLKRASSFL